MRKSPHSHLPALVYGKNHNSTENCEMKQFYAQSHSHTDAHKMHSPASDFSRSSFSGHLIFFHAELLSISRDLQPYSIVWARFGS